MNHIHHTVHHAIPTALVQEAQARGLALQNILELLVRYGPVALQILTEILAHFPKPQGA